MSKNDKTIDRINRSIRRAAAVFRPPDDLTVVEWAERYRMLSRETSAEAGPWRTSRTPYLKEPMLAFTDPKVRKIVFVAASQVGKTEVELNILGYIISQDPGTILYIHPTVDDGRKFSRQRIAPMIRECPILRGKVSDIKTRDSSNTILQKSFPGGTLTITGSNSASALASTPARYIIGDELDRWAISAGTEGDPWALAEARQTTFYNAKAIAVSTPTVLGSSNIAAAYDEGTQEKWCFKCPGCGGWHDIDFDNIKFDHSENVSRSKKIYKAWNIGWVCPDCGLFISESEVRKQPAKWIADKPDLIENGVRSFWLNAFSSPWTSWKTIILKYLRAKDDPIKLQVVFNTLFGRLWENRGDVPDEEKFVERREDYPAELANGVLVLTCGVDVQGDRLEYEVVGFGKFKESWGICRGVLPGYADSPEVWEKLDEIIDKTYYFQNGRGLRVSATFVDSGDGNHTQDVYAACRARFGKRVFAIKGRYGMGIPYTGQPKRIPVKDNKRVTCWLYVLGVDVGKTLIMDALKVLEPGAKFCHFPNGEERGYNQAYFHGLLSERPVLKHTRRGDVVMWEKLPGHVRNEPLDCRNYALAAFYSLTLDLEAIERDLRGFPEREQKSAPSPPVRTPRKRKSFYDDW